MKDISIQIGTPNEGDIITTEGKVDSLGVAMYNEFGKPLKDIAMVDEDWYKQVIYNRLTTQNPDWYHHPKIGGDLEDLIGELNTRETAQIGVRKITNALSQDGFISAENLSVRAVPVDTNKVMFFIQIYSPVKLLIYMPFSYTNGVEGIEIQ